MRARETDMLARESIIHARETVMYPRESVMQVTGPFKQGIKRVSRRSLLVKFDQDW